MIRVDRRRRPKVLLIGQPDSAATALAAQGFDPFVEARLSENLRETLGPDARHLELAVVSDLSGVSALAAASFVQAQLRRPVLSFPGELYPPIVRSLLHIAILAALNQGHGTTKAIAKATGYSERHVDAYLRELQPLVGADSRAEAIVHAYALGLIYRSSEAWNDPLGDLTRSS